jgi:hypothetical protein
MNWLDALERRAREAIKPAPTPQRQLPVRPLAQPDIKQVWVQTAAPRDGDAGAVEPGFYSVADGAVTMHDETGKPNGQRQQLGPGDDPHMVAGRMKRAAWIQARGESNFNRPLHYQRAGFV